LPACGTIRIGTDAAAKTKVKERVASARPASAARRGKRFPNPTRSRAPG